MENDSVWIKFLNLRLQDPFQSQQRSSVGYMQDEGASQEFQEWSREEIDENRPYPGPQSDPWISKR